MCVFVFVPVFGAARIKVLLTDTEYDLQSRGAVVESSTDNTVEGPGNGSLAPEGSGSAVHSVCRKQDGNVLPRCQLPVLFATGMGVWAECCLRTRDRDLKAPGSPALGAGSRLYDTIRTTPVRKRRLLRQCGANTSCSLNRGWEGTRKHEKDGGKKGLKKKRRYGETKI